MAKVSYKLIPSEFDISYKKALTPNDRYVFSSVRRTKLFTSKARIKGITQKSVLPDAAIAWNALTPSERDAWGLAGFETQLTGWRFFVKDFTWRRKLQLSGSTIPDLNYQVEVGRLQISAPANHIKIAQFHPQKYHVVRKIRGTKAQYETVPITENFALPLTLTINHHTNLTSAGGSPIARFYAIVYSHYQGRDIETEVEIPFGLTDAWQQNTVTISKVLGVLKGYTVFFEAYDVQGDIFFDNVSIVHSGQNWARDPRCYNIRTNYTRAFFQIPKHWVAVEVPQGSFFDSFYYNQI